MVQATTKDIEAKLVLQIPGAKKAIDKKVKTKMTYEDLMTQAKELAGKHDMLDDKDPIITYIAERQVTSDNDMEHAYSQAGGKKITFTLRTSKTEDDGKGGKRVSSAKGKKSKSPKKEKTDEEKAESMGKTIYRLCKKMGVKPGDFNPEEFAKAFGKQDEMVKMLGDPQEFQRKYSANPNPVFNERVM